MKGTFKLSLAIALALSGADVLALGLGQIQVKSGLNEPLVAEIPVISASPGESAGLAVALASNEDFARVGLNRGRLTVPLEFAVGTNARGDTVIRVTTQGAIAEPFLDFLVEANWTKGKLLREYTVLLDPPVLAPAIKGSTAAAAPVRDKEASTPRKIADEKPAKPTKPTEIAKVTPPPSESKSKPKPKPSSEPKAPKAVVAAEPKQPKPSTPVSAGSNQYGPVAEGETLSEVARAARPDERTNMNAMMLALLKSNPNAFYKDNINALKRGAVLHIPSSDEVKAAGASAEVAAQVRNQNEAWGSGAATSKPTLVADTGAQPKPATSAPKLDKSDKASVKPSERLALVPPKAGKQTQTSGDRPGAMGGTGKAAADSGKDKADLARTKESLAAREQEASDLKSRVKALEDLNTKNERMLTLKQSEIAELQRKLSDLQEASRKAASSLPSSTATAPTSTATVKPTDSKPVEPIKIPEPWGDASGKPITSSTKPATTTPPGTPATTGTAPTTGAVPATSTSATPTITTPPTPASTAPASTSSTTTPSTTSTLPSSTVGTTPTVSPSDSKPPSADSKPADAATSSSASTTSTTTPGESKPIPIAATPKPSAPKPIPEVPSAPWYSNTTVLLAGGAGFLLLGLLAVFKFMRKPKSVPVMGAMDDYSIDNDAASALAGEDERQLIDQLASNPNDAALHLELLSLYYAQRNVAKFEGAAESMYAHVADPNQAEWQQARAMGEELAPDNPLFGGDQNLESYVDHSHGDSFSSLAGTTRPVHEEEQPFDFGAFDPPAKGGTSAETAFDFDLAAPEVKPAATTTHRDVGPGFSAPSIPPPPVIREARTVVTATPAPVPVTNRIEEEFFTGEDAIGTKLDLAKAYLDMGDPDGARSMLEEVLIEGNDGQKLEARKLMADIK
jgi:pilus assembly protein FimV